MGAPPVYGNPFMQGLTGGLTQSVNKVLDEQTAKEQQAVAINKGILNALLQSGAPDIQALALAAMQNQKALKHLGGLADDPSYQQILPKLREAAAYAASKGNSATASPTTIAPPPGALPTNGMNFSGLVPPSVEGAQANPMTTPMGALLGGPPSGGDSASAGSPLAAAGQAPQSAALPNTSAIGSSPGAPQGQVDLTPAAGASPSPMPMPSPTAAPSAAPAEIPAAATPPNAGSVGTALAPAGPPSGNQGRVMDYSGYMHYLKSARDEIYLDAMTRRNNMLADLSKSNPLGFQTEAAKVPFLTPGEEAQALALGKAAALGQQYAAQGIPWEQAQKDLHEELSPVFAKANAVALAAQYRTAGQVTVEGVKQKDRIALEGEKHTNRLEEIQKRVSNRVQGRAASLQLIKTTDADGNLIQMFVPKEAGKVFSAPESATMRDRDKVANVSVNTGNDLLNMIKEPEYREQFGAVLGKYKNLEAAAGAGDPLAMELKGELMGFSALQLKIHGSRAYQIAQDVRQLLTLGQTPEAFEGGLKGIMKTSARLAAPGVGKVGGTGVTPPPGATTSPAGNAAPEGTVIMTPQGQMVKRGGQWVPAGQ